MAFKMRRGLDAERLAITPEIGEPIWTTDTKRLWVGDGITAGGIAVDAESYLNDEYLTDLTASMLTNSPHSGITFAYDDANNRLVATVNFPPSSVTTPPYFFNITGSDSTLTAINRSETVKFLGQNGINVSVDDSTGTTIVNIDGANVQGGGGDANLNDVGWFITGADSVQTRINNDETLQILGDNGITVSVNDALAPAQLTISSPVTPNTQAVFSIPYYTTQTGSTLADSGPDLRFMPEFGTLETNVVAAKSIAEVLKTSKFVVTNIQHSTPIVGRATITFAPAHPHSPYYTDRQIKITGGVGPNATWNGVYNTRPASEGPASTTNTLVIVTNKTDAFTPIFFTVTDITGTNTLTTSAPHGLNVGDIVAPRTTANGLSSTLEYHVLSAGLTSTQFRISLNAGGTPVTLTNGTGLTLVFDAQVGVQETSTTGINFFPNGEQPYITLGGTIDLNNGDGAIEYGSRFRLLDNSGFGARGNYTLAEFIQVHNDTFTNAINLTRGRGTFQNTTPVQAGDMLGSITFSGLDGVNSSFQNGYPPAIAAAIYVEAAETTQPIPQAPSVTGRMIFQVAKPGAGYTLTDAIVIDNLAGVNVPTKLTVSSTIKLEGNVISTVNSNANLDIRTNGSGIVNIQEDTNITGTLTVPTIDTADSSALNITPAAVFASDVFVQNDLTVTNKVYAKEFVSTSLGSSEIVSPTDFKIRVAGYDWAFKTTGEIDLAGASKLAPVSWSANGGSYVQLANQTLDNTVTVSDTGVNVTTNATAVSRNFFWNNDGGYQLPILDAQPPTPLLNTFYVADGVSWDPASKAGAVAYPVFYDGVTFNALY